MSSYYIGTFLKLQNFRKYFRNLHFFRKYFWNLHYFLKGKYSTKKSIIFPWLYKLILPSYLWSNFRVFPLTFGPDPFYSWKCYNYAPRAKILREIDHFTQKILRILQVQGTLFWIILPQPPNFPWVLQGKGLFTPAYSIHLPNFKSIFQKIQYAPNCLDHW